MKSLGLLLFVMYKFSNCGMELIFGASLKTTKQQKKKRLKVNIICAVLANL